MKIRKFAKILSEMNKILIFVANLLVCLGVANAGVRDGTTISRAKSDKTATQQRISTTVKRSTTPRTTALVPRTTKNTTASRSATTSSRTTNSATVSRSATATSRATNSATVSRSAVGNKNTGRVAARATSTPIATAMSSTRTGAEYEQCKNTYFSCMDQFCSLKNDDYRRCSCNDRIFNLIEQRENLQQAGEQLTVFTENLDVVGMTAAQATAMRTESEGEAALTDDKSASKALLQAIMNSIRGEDSSVGGKYSDLNSINISFDTVNAFGMTDVGQAIAAYNGVALYNAVYPQCRDAVRSDCNDASLQRAITAYLMAVEQDCNTVQTAIEKTQKDMKAAVREGSAMLDLARIENRQKHNSSDIPTCINAVETAILSEEVCGADYHKCLDNGEYIDVTTGKPIAGVKDFYKLENLLVFSDGIDAVNQKLSKNPTNRVFVQNFENRVKKFAAPALDTCVEDADTVWSEYLDRAMLSIYYAQKSKVKEIQQGCFDFVSACYMDGDASITAAMSELTTDDAVILQPDKIALNTAMCTEYVESCNNMFDGDIIAQYIQNRTDTDTLDACRAIVRQCFDKYGGTNYENFYYPYSGLFAKGSAPDWFTLYEYDENGDPQKKSECAKILTTVDSCNNEELIEQAFGGFDSAMTDMAYSTNGEEAVTVFYRGSVGDKSVRRYGLLHAPDPDTTFYTRDNVGARTPITGVQQVLYHRSLRTTGVATEVYKQVVSRLQTQCMALDGRFVELYDSVLENYDSVNKCQANFTSSTYSKLVDVYRINNAEDMCPRDYQFSVDVDSWGVCLCWENGARRSKNGQSVSCKPVLPVVTEMKDIDCQPTGTDTSYTDQTEKDTSSDTYQLGGEDYWCTRVPDKTTHQVCPVNTIVDDSGYCAGGGKTYLAVPDAL